MAKIESLARVLDAAHIKYEIVKKERYALLTIDGRQTKFPWDLFSYGRHSDASIAVEELLEKYNRT
ncbi:hypothetical protein ACFL1U_00115 [Patescibacteria group bacterium]